MKRLDTLDAETRTRIASALYKLAIREMKLSMRPLDAKKATDLINSFTENRIKALSAHLTHAPSEQGPVPTLSSKSPTVTHISAARTIVPDKGKGIRLALIFGPIKLREEGGSLGALYSKTEYEFGTGSAYNLLPLDRLVDDIFPKFLKGILVKTNVIAQDVRELSDRAYRIEHDVPRGAVASGAPSDKKHSWNVVHNGGEEDGRVVQYADPKIVAQMETSGQSSDNPSKLKKTLDPYRDAIFSSAEDASVVLNQLTRSTSFSSRALPKFKEYTDYIKYSAVYLQSSESVLDSEVYRALDQLLTEVDAPKTLEVAHGATPAETAILDRTDAAKESEELIRDAISIITEKNVSSAHGFYPEEFLKILKEKSPVMYHKYRPLMNTIVERLNVIQEQEEATALVGAKNFFSVGKKSPQEMLQELKKTNPELAKKYRALLPRILMDLPKSKAA